MAFADAKADAETLAKAAGLTLGSTRQHQHRPSTGACLQDHEPRSTCSDVG